jgi:hypothetical protein
MKAERFPCTAGGVFSDKHSAVLTVKVSTKMAPGFFVKYKLSNT